MTDSLEQRIIEVIRNALLSNGAAGDIVVTGSDSMETLAAWDSLTFMSVFLSINETFGINPDFDDAIHYTSVQSLHAYVREKLASGVQ
jgi:acyl carrier protein